MVLLEWQWVHENHSPYKSETLGKLTFMVNASSQKLEEECNSMYQKVNC